MIRMDGWELLESDMSMARSAQSQAIVHTPGVVVQEGGTRPLYCNPLTRGVAIVLEAARKIDEPGR